MPDSSRVYSSLYYRLLAARRTIPLIASIGVIAVEIAEHGVLLAQFEPVAVVELLIFAFVGPGLTFLALTWLAERVAERDRAERELARTAAHVQQLLATFERIVRTEQPGFVPMLEHMLAAICEGQAIASGAVYLLPAANPRSLTPAVYWPTPGGNGLLDDAARSIAKAEPALLAESGGLRVVLPSVEGNRVVAASITGAGERVGLLVLALPLDVKLPESNILNIVTSTMALVIRNGQLYARLQTQAVLEERNELAREVHDTLAQSMGFLSLQAQHAQRLIERGMIQEASAVLEELSAGSRQGYDEVRQMIRELRSPAELSGGLAHCLQEYAVVAAARTGLQIAVDAQSEPRLSADACLQLFRVVQEAVNNIYRHAQACHVVIRLAEEPESVFLSVEDDGSGLPSAGVSGAEWSEAFPASHGAAASGTIASGEHLGLRIMAERVRSIGGELQLESHSGAGTLLKVRVPSSSAPALLQEDVWTVSVS